MRLAKIHIVRIFTYNLLFRFNYKNLYTFFFFAKFENTITPDFLRLFDRFVTSTTIAIVIKS